MSCRKRRNISILRDRSGATSSRGKTGHVSSYSGRIEGGTDPYFIRCRRSWKAYPAVGQGFCEQFTSLWKANPLLFNCLQLYWPHCGPDPQERGAMNFADVNAAVGDLRHAVNTQVEQNAFKDIGTRGPAGVADEAGFLRLVSWSYAFLYERGRIVIPFLLQVPGEQSIAAQDHTKTRKAVQTLRTWFFHGLDSDSDRDFEIGRAASGWFLAHCQTTSPQTASDWDKAFRYLCEQVRQIAVYCTVLISNIAGDSERAELQFGALRLRIKRDWQAFEYDKFVEDAATRLGERIEAKGFRERRLAEWRKFLVTLPEDADLRAEMQRGD